MCELQHQCKVEKGIHSITPNTITGYILQQAPSTLIAFFILPIYFSRSSSVFVALVFVGQDPIGGHISSLSSHRVRWDAFFPGCTECLAFHTSRHKICKRKILSNGFVCRQTNTHTHTHTHILSLSPRMYTHVHKRILRLARPTRPCRRTPAHLLVFYSMPVHSSRQTQRRYNHI